MVEKAYNHPDLIRMCKHIAGQEWEDIRGEVITKFLELPEERRNKVKDVVGFMVRMCRNYGLDWHKKRKPELIPDFAEIADKTVTELRIMEKILQDCNSVKRFYHARIFVYCNQLGSVKAYSKTTSIPYSELSKAYKDYKIYLQNWLKTND